MDEPIAHQTLDGKPIREHARGQQPSLVTEASEPSRSQPSMGEEREVGRSLRRGAGSIHDAVTPVAVPIMNVLDETPAGVPDGGRAARVDLVVETERAQVAVVAKIEGVDVAGGKQLRGSATAFLLERGAHHGVGGEDSSAGGCQCRQHAAQARHAAVGTELPVREEGRARELQRHQPRVRDAQRDRLPGDASEQHAHFRRRVRVL